MFIGNIMEPNGPIVGYKQLSPGAKQANEEERKGEQEHRRQPTAEDEPATQAEGVLGARQRPRNRPAHCTVKGIGRECAKHHVDRGVVATQRVNNREDEHFQAQVDGHHGKMGLSDRVIRRILTALNRIFQRAINAGFLGLAELGGPQETNVFQAIMVTVLVFRVRFYTGDDLRDMELTVTALSWDLHCAYTAYMMRRVVAGVAGYVYDRAAHEASFERAHGDLLAEHGVLEPRLVAVALGRAEPRRGRGELVRQDAPLGRGLGRLPGWAG